MDASYCFLSIPKQIQLGLQLHCPIRRFIHLTSNTPTRDEKLTKISENLFRHTLLVHSNFQGLWQAYRRAWGVLKLGRGSATRSSSSGPSSSMLGNPISSWNWGEWNGNDGISWGTGMWKSLQQWEAKVKTTVYRTLHFFFLFSGLPQSHTQDD